MIDLEMTMERTSFDGNDLIDIPDDPSLTLGSKFTIVTWAQMNSYGTDGAGYYYNGAFGGAWQLQKNGFSGLAIIISNTLCPEQVG